MLGVSLGEYHSYNDFSLVLNSKEIGSPEIKVKKVEIEGANSDIDYTDFFGEPKYSNVRHTFNFSLPTPPAEHIGAFTRIKNALHGKKMRIVLDDDPLFYYMGRVTVSSFTREKNIGAVRIEADCEPYKYRATETTVTRAVNGSTAITLSNLRKRVVPTITASAPMTIAFNGFSSSAGAGNFTIPELELIEGNNIVTVSGTGTITFTYREAQL